MSDVGLDAELPAADAQLPVLEGAAGEGGSLDPATIPVPVVNVRYSSSAMRLNR